MQVYFMKKQKETKRKPRVCVLSAFQQGLEIISFLISEKYTIKLVCTYSKDETIYEKKISQLCDKNNIKIIRKINVNDEKFIKFLRNEKIDLVVLAWWPEIVKKEAIESVKIGWINLHPSYLPFGRGKHAYFWAIIEKHPFGATIHFIDEGIDSGKILFQKEIPVNITDTGESLYRKGVDEVISLFKENCNKIMNLNFTSRIQKRGGTHHFAKEIESISKIELNKKYIAGTLIDILRARSFDNGPSSYFYINGEKYYLKLKIIKAN